RNNAGLCALCRLAIYPSIRLWCNTTHRSHLGRFYVAVLIDRMIALCFQANPRIKRVLFVCTPHRGSETALSGLGRFGRSLIALPLAITGTLRESLTDVDLSQFTGSARRLPNSVSGLSPKNPTLKIVNSAGISAPYHSIIGDRGKGDTPNSTDGVVPYWSSHLDGAQSEVIVPGPHGSQNLPQTIAELHRFLRLHLKNSGDLRTTIAETGY